MLKKIVFAAAFVALSAAPPAAAWEEVCVKLPLWKTWFSADFWVVHGFHADYGELPGAYVRDDGSVWALPDTVGGNTRFRARAAIESPGVAVNQEKCVSIAHLEEGEPFFVYVQPHVGYHSALCETHPSNPERWYFQTGDRPYRKLHYEAWGGVAHPQCKFVRES